MFLFFNTLSKQDIYPKAAEYVFLSNAQKAFSRIDHILGCKSSLGTCKKTEIISNIFSQTQHYGIRSKLQGEKSLKWKRKKNTWSLINLLFNNQWITEEFKKENLKIT